MATATLSEPAFLRPRTQITNPQALEESPHFSQEGSGRAWRRYLRKSILPHDIEIETTFYMGRDRRELMS